MTATSNDAGDPSLAPRDGAAEAFAPDLAGTAPAGAGWRWRELLALDLKLHEERGVRLLTPEARVLLYLRLEGSVPVTTAMHAAGTSYRGFYAVLDRLRQAGLVATVKDANDQRVKRLSLAPEAALSGVRS